MNHIQVETLPKLRDPILIVAMRGWNDGGRASTNALKYLIRSFEANQFASMDPEDFYVFSENRPHVELVDGQTRRRIKWQKNEFYHASLPGTERDVVMMLGTEPNLKWRTFCEEIEVLMEQLGVKTVVTLGAFLGDVLYTLPVQINGFSNDSQLMDEHKLERTSYEGPTGIIGVLTSHLQETGLTTLSLWGAVPYYISVPNPKAVFAILSKLKAIFRIDLDMSDLEQEAENFDNEINDIVSKDPNVAAYVRELKKREFLN